MENDQYYLANEKLINADWLENNLRLEREEKAKQQFLGLDEYSWGGGRYTSPPF